MRTLTAVVLAAAFTAGMVAPMSAQANCTQIIYAERAFSNGTTAQVLGRNTALDTFQWFANTTDDQLASMIFSAVSQHNRVTVTGNAATCPAAGSTRFMGTIIQMFISP